MRAYRNMRAIDRQLRPKKETSEPRKAGRLRPARLYCQLGRVLDISGRGMRVRADKQPEFQEGAEMSVWIDADDQRIELASKVVWLRKAGLREWDMGFSFTDVPDEMRPVLSGLARGIAGESEICRDPEGTKHR